MSELKSFFGSSQSFEWDVEVSKSAETTCQRPAGVDQKTKGTRLKHTVKHSCDNTRKCSVSQGFLFVYSLKHLARPSLLRSWWSQVRDLVLIHQQSLNKITRLVNDLNIVRSMVFDSFKFRVATGNLPDPGKAQDFVKKLAQVLDDDERIRDQLETLVSPSCSCKQAEVCVVSSENYRPRWLKTF